VLLLQPEAEGKLSINDRIGKWLPQYRAWRNITIRRLLDMTSGIPDYTSHGAFQAALQAAPAAARFSAARLVSYVADLPAGSPATCYYSNTDYILAQMIIERVTHDSYADQLMKRIIIPLRLNSMCYGPYTCPAAAAAAMPAGYWYINGIPQLAGRPVPPLALTNAPVPGGTVSSLQDMMVWDRALYQGRELPRRSSASSKAWCRSKTGSRSGGRHSPTPAATALASRRSPPRGAGLCGPTKAGPWVTTSCACTFTSPAPD
jgi:D-alanyl-D-alanine carboxypeptidase